MTHAQTEERTRHRLDDALGDRAMLMLFLVAQGWSTWGMIRLAWMANFDFYSGLVPAILIDGTAFIAARDAAREQLPNEKGWRIRPLAAFIAAACFLVSLAGNVTYAHLSDPVGVNPLLTYLHDALSGAPVALLVATLVLRTRRAAWREREIARELTEAQAKLERDAERAKKREDRAKPPRESQPGSREFAPAAPAAASPVPANAGVKPQVRKSKQQQAREYIGEQIELGRGHELTNKEVDQAIDGKTTGGIVLREMRANGECPKEGEPVMPRLAAVAQ